MVVGGWHDAKRAGHSLHYYELSARPSYLAAAKAEDPGPTFSRRQLVSLSGLSKKVTYQGCVLPSRFPVPPPPGSHTSCYLGGDPTFAQLYAAGMTERH